MECYLSPSNSTSYLAWSPATKQNIKNIQQKKPALYSNIVFFKDDLKHGCNSPDEFLIQSSSVILLYQ